MIKNLNEFNPIDSLLTDLKEIVQNSTLKSTGVISAKDSHIEEYCQICAIAIFCIITFISRTLLRLEMLINQIRKYI